MSIPDVKYTDEDVRTDGELLRRAESYAKYYRGDFDYLVKAHEMVIRNGYLTIGVARGVLNCMRLDGRVADTLPAPIASVRRDAGRQLRVVRNTPRSVFVRPKEIKRPYLISLHKTARTIHEVDVAYSGFVFWYDENNNLIKVQERARGKCCTSYPRQMLLSQTGMQVLLPEGYKMCRRCEFYEERDAD